MPSQRSPSTPRGEWSLKQSSDKETWALSSNSPFAPQHALWPATHPWRDEERNDRHEACEGERIPDESEGGEREVDPEVAGEVLGRAVLHGDGD